MICNVEIYWLWKSRHRQTFWRWWRWGRIFYVKSLNTFLYSQFHSSLISPSWAQLRVGKLHTLVNLAYCSFYCKLKLHSSPNTISSTVEIIWKYFVWLWRIIRVSLDIPTSSYFFSGKLEKQCFLCWSENYLSWFLSMLTIRDTSWIRFLMTMKYNENTKRLPSFRNFFRVTSL